MISSKRFESVDGTTSRFLSDFIIQSEQHCRVYMYKYNASCALDSSCNTIIGGVYIRQTNTPQSADLVTLDKWDLVDNSIVFYITPTAGVTIVIEVATTPEEFGAVVAMPIIALAESYATSAALSATSATTSATSANLSATSATASALSATNSANSATASALSATNNANTSTFQAGIATTKAAEATADVVLTHADVVLTHADVVLTHADVVLTHADVVTSTTQAGNSLASATLAQKWASELENVIVLGGLYSAYHWALKAAASAAALIIDALPTNGSTNAVSSDGVFDALALKRAKEDTISTMTIVDTTIIPIGNAVGQYIKLSAILGIVSFGPSVTGVKRKIEFVLSTTLINHNATSLILPAGVDILAVVGDVMEVVCINGALGYWKCISYSVNNISITDSKNYLSKAGGTMTGAITALRETKVAMGANDINLASGNLFTKTISGATTLTVSNWLATGNANSFILELTNGGSAVVTYFAGVKWASGTAPTLTAAGVDILGFYSHDGGTTVRGIVLSKDSK